MRTYTLKIASLFFFAVAFLFMYGSRQACCAPVPGIDVTYTSDADFDKGTLMNLDHNPVHDQLKLSDTTTPFPFINIAKSGKGTIVRIDVNTGVILGEYFTSPDNMKRNPSRTTVDQSGNVWVSNRDESGTSGGVSKGSITRVGLIIGGTRVNADGSVNPTGQYLKPPFQYNTCIDRNGDGLIKTSRGADNMLAWSNAGNVDSNGGVSTADDECIINYTRVVATNTRTVAIDANNDVWVGGANTAHEKVNGLTGQPVPGTQFNLGCGGYGGLIDKNGVLWSARYGSGLLRYDTKTKTGACLGNGKGDYGLGVDPNTGEIWHTFLEYNRVAKLAPDGTLLGIYNHGAHYSQGVVVDKNGNVWVAHSLYDSSVGHLRTNGTYVGNIATGAGPTGVSVDANGKVWSANYNAWTANRIDPNAGSTGGGGFKIGAVDQTVNLGNGSYPYNYSDMTGYVAIGGTSPQGSWSVVQDSGVASNKWGTITWNKESQGSMPAGSIILVEARTSDSEAGLGSKDFTAVSNNQPFSLIGRFIEVRVTLKPNSTGEKPVLSDLRISMTPMSNVRVIDTISSGNIVINSNSFTTQPYSITNGIDTSVIEWRFDAFTIGQINDLSYTVSMKNPIPGEDRLVSHKVEVLYTDINGNPVRNEIGPQSVHVLNSQYAASLVLDKRTYGAKENVLINAGITNLSLFARTLDAKITIEDSGGAIVQEVATLPGLQFALGETKNFSNLVFNTGTNFPGGYRARIRLYEGQSQVGTASADFTITSDIAASSSVVTDKVSYKPNDQATITAAVKSLSQNSLIENLSAKVTIKDPAGNVQLYTVTKSIPALLPGISSSFTANWNTGTNPAGSYPVTLQVFDAAGVVISTANCSLVISSTTKPTALLKGQIALDKQNILTGEPVTASYSVTNAGNVDLSGVSLSVQTINLAEEVVYNTIADQATLVMGASYAKTGMIDTTTYSAKDYLVILRASINGVEETLASTYFRVEGAPSAPALISPANGADEDTFTPALTVSNASDPNDDKLTYEFEIYSDNGLTNLVNSSGAVAETAGSTAWTVSAPLTENLTYFWRARAWDGKLYGPWMETASFRVNTVNDPPTAPVISSPVDNGVVSNLTQTLTVLNATDPDSPSLTYNFDLALDAGFTQIVSSTTGIAQGTGTTSWQVPVTLAENTTYYWRSQADDWMVEGPWSTTGRFFVNTVNDPPSTPVIIAPVKGASIKALEADVMVQNSIDPDSPDITYTFELDTVMSFDSPAIIRSGNIQQGQNSTTWHVTGLTEDTQYYVRAKASDGQAESAWSGIVDFFTNATNSAPTAPTLANPSNGAGVTVFTPTLSVHNSTDPDRDVLTYDFQLFADAGLTNLVTNIAGVTETSQTTSWTVPVTLTENKTYYWQARASDGKLQSPWMAQASFTINTANDAPGAPVLISPTNGSAIATLTPELVITNAKDPDNDKLTYEYEVYQGSVLVAGIKGVPENSTGTTSATLTTSLTDNTVYQWRARAFDGERYGPWTAMASFTVHTCQHKLKVDIDFEPDTLNKKDCGKWVLVRIELPHGYRARDVDISSIRLEGTVQAELWPFECGHHHHEHGCDHDRHGHHHEVLMVKFRRSEVIKVLPAGKHVPVHVTGMVKSIPFEGVDIIRVTSSGHCCGGH